MSQPPESAAVYKAKYPFFIRLHSLEDHLVGALFLLVTLLPVLEMLLRFLFGQGLPSEAVIVQHFTFWAAFLGAMLCSREESHLSLSTAELLPAGRPRRIARLFTHSVAAAVTLVFAYASLLMVIADSEGDQLLVAFVREWWSEALMPVALGFMAIRLWWRAAPDWKGRAIAAAAIGACVAVPFVGIAPESLLVPGALLILLALLGGAPIYVGMGGLAMILYYGAGGEIAAVPSDALRLAQSPMLPSVPLLTMAGYVMSEGGAARRLVVLFRALFGWMPGGVSIAVCCVCAIFTALTGGSGVTILALGGLMLPILVQEAYPEDFSLGLVTASGSLGLLFPPSVPVILYGIVAQLPNANVLFVAGLVPGLLMIALVCGYGMFLGVKHKTPRHPFRLAEAGRAFWDAKWELGVPVIMALAIGGGIGTMIEGAALAALYSVVVQVLIYKDIPLKKLPGTLARAAALVGAVLIVLAVAMGLTGYIVDAELAAALMTWVKAHVETQMGFLLVLNLVLLVVGSVVEIFSAVFILPPLIAPLGEAFGVDRIHLAIVFLANLELGFLLPPVGLNLFLSSTRFKKPLPKLYRVTLPFLLIMTLGVLLVTYVPALTTGVVALFGMTPPTAP